MRASAPVYDRAPSRELLALVSPGGLLAPLVELASREVNGHYHDVHFRPKEQVHVYRGRTRLIRVERPVDGRVNLTANDAYTRQPGSKGLFRQWSVDEAGLAETLNHYLSTVKVGRSWITGEAIVQEGWARIQDPWIPFDREGVLGGLHDRGADFPAVGEAQSALNALARSNRWPPPEATGFAIDQLAIDPQGRLVLLELKDASKSNDKVYYSPFQLLQYVWEWHGALSTVRANLQAVIDARVAVGLTPLDVPPLSGGIRAAVGFGFKTPGSDTKRNYAEVLKVVNRHLPDRVMPVETWTFSSTGPTRLEI